MFYVVFHHFISFHLCSVESYNNQNVCFTIKLTKVLASENTRTNSSLPLQTILLEKNPKTKLLETNINPYPLLKRVNLIWIVTSLSHGFHTIDVISHEKKNQWKTQNAHMLCGHSPQDCLCVEIQLICQCKKCDEFTELWPTWHSVLG